MLFPFWEAYRGHETRSRRCVSLPWCPVLLRLPLAFLCVAWPNPHMQVDTLIIGAGAAGMMCAAHSGGRTLVVDHAKSPGEKIRISGGGRCNFTNLEVQPDRFLGQNPHFHKSALARYTQWDFIELVAKHGIAYHEKTLGQLFCDTSAREIIDMLLAEMRRSGADLWLSSAVTKLEKSDDGFNATITRDGQNLTISARNVVVATGGKSIPKMGATGFAYDIARQFGIAVTDTRPGLVPFTFPEGRFKPLAGVALDTVVTTARTSFSEALLFTHRGLSGPAILQASSYWREAESISVNLIPNIALFDLLRAQRQREGRRNLTTELAAHLPSRLVDFLANTINLGGNLADQSDKRLTEIINTLQNWSLAPSGSEGYRTAEVTLGGIDTNGLDSASMMSKSVTGLYFVGEAVDVTGWLGGYNFQWAWSSGWAAGTHIAQAK